MIRAENLWKKFGRHEALRGLNFAVSEGSTFALIGANGAGGRRDLVRLHPTRPCTHLCFDCPRAHTQRNPKSAGHVLQTDYAPYRRSYIPGALSRFTERLAFGDASGTDLVPVKEPMLPESQVKARLYEPQEHFSRQLVIPEIRLRDWA
ncbi:MAG: hypothetical protein ABSB35_27440 [Bryobacteraceae bacterium]|jgi:hypothetical protein